jgi:hypothetical protein
MLRKVAVLTTFIAASATGVASAATFTDLSAFLAATGPNTVVDFNAAGSGAILNTYAGLGVTFSSGNTFADCVQETSPPYCWLNNTSDGADGRIFDATFIVGGITAVGINSVLGGGFSILRAYDAGNVLLGTVSSDSVSSTLDFFGLTTTAPIAYITVQFPAPVSGWALDDLRFGAAADVEPVPEPATLLLMGAGLAGARCLRRRRTQGL